MPAPYTTPNINDTRSLLNLAIYESTNFNFMPLVLLTIYLIIFIGGIITGRRPSRAFTFASLICSVFSMIFSLIGLIDPQYMYFAFLLTGIGFVWNKLDSAPGI